PRFQWPDLTIRGCSAAVGSVSRGDVDVVQTESRPQTLGHGQANLTTWICSGIMIGARDGSVARQFPGLSPHWLPFRRLPGGRTESSVAQAHECLVSLDERTDD